MLTIDTITSKFYINSYADKVIDLSESTLDKDHQKIMHRHCIISTCYVSFEDLIIDFNVERFTSLNLDALTKIKDIEILLIGTGKKHKFPEKGLYSELKNLAYSVDFMNTHAACRTFNILVNESRKVGALLFI